MSYNNSTSTEKGQLEEILPLRDSLICAVYITIIGKFPLSWIHLGIQSFNLFHEVKLGELLRVKLIQQYFRSQYNHEKPITNNEYGWGLIFLLPFNIIFKIQQMGFVIRTNSPTVFC